jgi:hypothetical protein
MNFFRNLIEPMKYSKIGFDDVKFAINHPDSYILINTLSIENQKYLIKCTLPISIEESIINKTIEDYEMNRKIIIIYGKNATDNTVEIKANQILGLGFTHVFLYYGGIFEWLLLQEIYGYNEFPTIIHNKNIDLLFYKPDTIFPINSK